MLTCATYNIHEWVGGDLKYAPERIVGVINELGCDIIGLQEVSVPRQIDNAWITGRVAAQTGLRTVLGPTLVRGNADYGNALLSAYPIINVRRVDISVISREPRGILDVDIDVKGMPIRVITTHLGLKRRERRLQIQRLEEILANHKRPLTLLMGDFNEWFYPYSATRKLLSRFACTRLPTFPAYRPLFKLDYIAVQPCLAFISCRVHRSRLARMASDHFPLKAHIDVDCLKQLPAMPRI